jgi:hypothetical protein
MVTKFEPIARSNRFHNRGLNVELICCDWIYIDWACNRIVAGSCRSLLANARNDWHHIWCGVVPGGVGIFSRPVMIRL